MPKNQIQYLVDLTNKLANNVEYGDRRLNILMTSTHPMTDFNICKTGHNFYNLCLSQFPIKWPKDLQVPSNMVMIKSLDELPHQPDLILSQNVVDQYNVFKQLSHFFDCPLIEFEHTMPTDEWVKLKVVDQLKNELQANKYIYITNASKIAWGREKDDKATVINHMIDTNEYSGWLGGNGRAMCLVNAFRTRIWAVGNPAELMLKDDRIDLFGHNPGFNSMPLNKAQVIQTMQTYSAFINTSIRSPIPASIIEAAAVGMPIISRKTCAIPEFFKDEESILFYDTPEQAVLAFERIILNKEFAAELGKNARKVALDFFNESRYVKDWNSILYTMVGEYHGAC